MSGLFHPSYSKTDPDTGRSVKKRVRKWYGRYNDADGVERRVPLCEDKAAAQTMLADLVRKVDRVRAGLVDPAEEHLDRSVQEHLADYRASLEVKARDEKHVRDTVRTIRRITTACRFHVLAELQRGNDQFEQYLAVRMEAGRSHRTINADLVAVRSFCRWLISRQRMHLDPTSGLERLNVDEDRRRQRRALTEDESRKLLQATLASKRDFRGLSGPDRALLYLVAQRTGLRRKELVSLTTKSFDFSIEPAAVALEAASSKHRKVDVLPLTTDVAAAVRDYLLGKAADAQLWPGAWWRRAAEMLRCDLAEAGIEPVDAEGRVLDFHGQRTTFITSLARAGVTPALAQRLARHSDINLTLGTYTRLHIGDLAGAVDKLPDLSNSKVVSSSQLPAGEVEVDPRLEQVCQAWPKLAENVRQTIVALLATVAHRQ